MMEQVVIAVLIAAILQVAASISVFLVFKAQATEWHRANQSRLIRIEKSLGIDDPNESAFLRRSEAVDEHRRIWNKLDDHDERIDVLEKR